MYHIQRLEEQQWFIKFKIALEYIFFAKNGGSIITVDLENNYDNI